MPFFLVEATYTADAWAKLVENPQDRTEPTRKVAEAFGGRMHHVFFSFGTYDVVCLFELPDNKAAMALAAKITAAGSVTAYRTTVLFTAAETKEALEQSRAAGAAYQPPFK
jgi:uncharacterized protein with GYD domain